MFKLGDIYYSRSISNRYMIVSSELAMYSHPRVVKPRFYNEVLHANTDRTVMFNALYEDEDISPYDIVGKRLWRFDYWHANYDQSIANQYLFPVEDIVKKNEVKKRAFSLLGEELYNYHFKASGNEKFSESYNNKFKNLKVFFNPITSTYELSGKFVFKDSDEVEVFSDYLLDFGAVEVDCQ